MSSATSQPAPFEAEKTALLTARYGQQVPYLAQSWSDTLNLLLEHKSTRAYLPEPIEHGLIETMVAAAQSAASSSNIQAWSVVAVRDPARKERLAALSGGNQHIVEAPVFLVWLADLSRSRALTERADLPGEALDYLETFLLAAIDASLAAQNAVVAAESLNLGTCYIGGMRNKPAEVAKELGLPAECVAVFGMTVGYPDESRASQVKPRLPQSLVLHNEYYGDGANRAQLSNYDATLSAFQEAQGMPVTNWTALIAKRVGTAAALRGRDKLAEILKSLGFGIR